MIWKLALAGVLLMTIPLTPATAQEIPNPPATFAGTVTVDGHSVSDGTAVIALIDGKKCGEGEKEPGQKGTWTATEARPEYDIEIGDSMYVVDVVSDSQVPGCGTDGATVTFLIAGRPSQEVGLWRAGSNPLNLTVGTSPGAGESATTPSAGEAPASPELETSDDSGFNWWLVAAGGGAGLAAVAIAAALWQARRTARRKQA